MRLSLRNKIFFSFMFLIFILALISFHAIKSLIRLGEISEEFVMGNYNSISAAYGMLNGLEGHQKAEYRLVAGLKKDAEESFAKSSQIFTQSLEKARENANLEGERELVDAIERTYIDFLENYHWLERNLDKKGTDEWKEKRNRLLEDVYSMRQNIQRILKKNSDNMKLLSQQSRQLSNQFISSMIIFSIIALVVGFGTSLWLTHIIVEPVEKLTKAVMEIRKGNLDIKVNTENPDEIGILATELNRMTERLKSYQKLNLEKLIEEKKRSEAILRSVGDGMIVIDPDYKIIMVNPTAERIFYLLPGISHGRDFKDMIKSEKLFNIIKSCIEKKNFSNTGNLPTFEWEYDRVKKHFQVKVFPVEKEDGEIIAYVILLEDVTKLKHLDQMKSDFISIASHELRSPLTSIIMSLGMVVDGVAGPLTKDQKELLDAAYEDAKRMRHLMTNLLDISRIETGRLEMDKVPVSPYEMVQKVKASFHPQVQSKNINLVINVPEDLPKVLADENRLLQVFNNLMTNALRYTPEGGRISISAEKAGDFVKFSVADNGPGISREYQKKIFQKFVQVDNDPKPGGAGLGLALCQEIIKAHGGNIWVESEIGKGANFQFTLPIAKSEKEQET